MTINQALYRSITLLLALCLTTQVLAGTIDRTIAKLNDDILTESDLAEIVADVAGEFNPLKQAGYDGATSDTVRAMFDRALLLQEARRRKITPDNEELHRQVEGMVRDIRANFSSESEFHHALAAERLSLDQLKKELLDKTKTDYMVYHVVNSQFSISDEEVEKFKQQQQAEGDAAASFRLRRLGIPVKKEGGSEAACREARSLVARIITEGISFEEGVRKYSQVPGANADGGDMGYMAVDKLSGEVRNAVQKLEVGQATPPVVAGGFANIFYVEGKRGAQSAVREKKFFEARGELLDNLRRKAILQVFDSRLTKIMPDEYQRALVGSASEVGNEAGKRAAEEKPAAAPSEAPPRGSDIQHPTQQQQQQGPVQGQPPYQQAQPTPQARRFPNWFGRQQ